MTKAIKITWAIALIMLFPQVHAEKIAEATQSQESNLSKILKSSGSLVARESYKLSSLSTISGKDLESEIMIVRSLLNKTGNDIFVGLILKAREKYASKTANIDPDEVDGLLSSINLIQKKGASIIDNPSAKSQKAIDISTEIHYRTKDGLVFAAFKSGGKLKYGIKVSSGADWALLQDKGVETLKENLIEAKKLAKSLK